MASRIERWKNALLSPVDNASIIVFRIGFGVIMIWEVFRYLSKGWIERYYMNPEYFFSYYGFEWVQPWPGDWMIVHFWVLGILALCIAAGFLYRIAMPLFFLGFTYVFLLDQTRYLNHFYFVALLCFLMMFVPAHQAYSIDAKLRTKSASDYAPLWALWVLRMQLVIVYFYAGVAKINADWLLRGEPLKSWMADNSDFPILGPWMTEPWLIWPFVYGGLLLDLFVGPALLWKRTRPYAFVFAVTFHVFNAFMFSIGIFPWLMIVATTIFFAPDWPRKILGMAKPLKKMKPLKATSAAVLPILAVYVVWQVLFPLRHWLYPGDVNWTEEGHKYSWRMKLRDKETDWLVFWVKETPDAEFIVYDIDQHLTNQQIDKMGTRPDMILQFAHFVADELETKNGVRPIIHVETLTSVNGNPSTLMIDNQVDLASQSRNPWVPWSWITRP